MASLFIVNLQPPVQPRIQKPRVIALTWGWIFCNSLLISEASYWTEDLANLDWKVEHWLVKVQHVTQYPQDILHVCLHLQSSILFFAIHYFLFISFFLKKGQMHCFHQRRKSISFVVNSKKEKKKIECKETKFLIKKMKRGLTLKNEAYFGVNASLQSSYGRDTVFAFFSSDFPRFRLI